MRHTPILRQRPNSDRFVPDQDIIDDDKKHQRSMLADAGWQVIDNYIFTSIRRTNLDEVSSEGELGSK